MRASDLDIRVIKALDKVDKLTLQRRAQWEKFSLGTRRDAYSYDLSNSSIVIFSKDKDGLAPFVIQIRDENGSVVESLRTADLTSTDSDTETFIEWVEEFYSHARRSALRTDSVLDELLAELDEE